MNSEEVVKELKDVMLRIAHASNLMKDGKVILSYEKMIGVYQKIGGIINQINSDNLADKKAATEKVESQNEENPNP